MFHGSQPPCKQNRTRAFQGLQRDLPIYLHRGFRITTVHADGEFSPLKTLTESLPGGPRLNLASSNEHVPEIERRIRVVKEHICSKDEQQGKVSKTNTARKTGTSKAPDDGWIVVKAKRVTSNVQEKYTDSNVTDEDRESVGHGKQKNPFAVLCDDDDIAFGSIEDDGDDNEEADTYDDECDTEEGSGDIDKDDDDSHNGHDDNTNVQSDTVDDQERDTDDEEKEVRDNEYDKDDDDVDVVAGNDDDDGCVDEDDDVDDNQEDEQIDVKTTTIKSDDIPIGITRTGTKFRGVATINDEEQSYGSDGNKPDKGKDSKTWNLNTEKKRKTKKAKGTCHSRLNFRGDEQVTKNTMNPKTKSVLHDFATDGKDDND
jgi:hypothetical protein